MIAWYIVPYKRDVGIATPARYCAIQDHTPLGVGRAWTESEVLGDRAIVKVRAPAEMLAVLDGVYRRLPKNRLDDSLADVSVEGKRALVDEMADMGYSPAEIGAGLPADLGACTLGDVLRFMATRRRKPRWNRGSDEIVLDGEVQACRPVDELAAWELGDMLGLMGARRLKPGRGGVIAMGVPVSDVLDDFNRANGDLGANWQEMMRSGNDFLIDTNQCKPDGWNAEIWNVSQPGPACEVYVTIATLQAQGVQVLVYARMKDITVDLWVYDGYSVKADRWNNGGTDTMRISITRVDNSVATQLGAAVDLTDQANGDKLGLRVVGGLLIGYYGPTFAEQMQRSDATYAAAGYLAMYLGDDANLRVDDFGGGTILAHLRRRREKY